jgi:hypothetical protein
LFGGNKSARTTTTMPTLSPEYKTLADLLRSRVESRLSSMGPDLSGYQTSGIGDINTTFGGIQRSIANNLTARGLGTSPVAGAVGANLDIARGQKIADFMNQIPLLQRQFQNEDMANALQVLNLGRGATSVGPGSGFASALSAGGATFADILGILNGMK